MSGKCNKLLTTVLSASPAREFSADYHHEMSEFMKRAACHEAGHIIVAFKQGIRVEGVRVANGLLLTDVWADDLDSTSRPAIDR